MFFRRPLASSFFSDRLTLFAQTSLSDETIACIDDKVPRHKGEVP